MIYKNRYFGFPRKSLLYHYLNLHHLVEAFSRIDAKGCKLVLAGDTDFEDDYSRGLKEMARRNGVVLTGFVKGRKLHALLTNARCFVLPSSHEGLPIALLEAMSYRLPVVVSGIKYPDENVLKKMPNVSGYVSKPDFSVLLEEAIRMFPSRTEIVCLSDSSFLSRKGVEQVEEVWEGLKQKYPKHSLKKMNVQAQSLNSIITSICYDYNAYKHIVIAPKWIPFLSLKLKSPVFASQNLAMTNGVLCVYDVVPSEDTYAAGKWAARILKGKEPFSLGVTNFTGKLLYDYKQLEFFHIDAGRVEAEGVILNVPLVERYRVWFSFFYSVVVGAFVLLVAWLYRMNRRESRRRIHAQTRLLIQHRLVEQRDEFDNIFCSIRDGLITYDIDFRIHFVNRSLMMMLGVDSEVHTARYYEGQMAGSIFRIYMDGEDVLHKLLKQVYSERKPVPIPENAFMQEKDKENYFPISGEVVPIFSNEQMTVIFLRRRCKDASLIWRWRKVPFILGSIICT